MLTRTLGSNSAAEGSSVAGVGRWEWRLWRDRQPNALGCTQVSCKIGLDRNLVQSEDLLPDRSSECPRRLVLGWRTLLPLDRLQYNSSALVARLMVLR